MSYQKNKCRKSNCDQDESRNVNNRYENCNNNESSRNCDEDENQRHVHEYASNVRLAEECQERHTHRVAGVTGEAILINGGRNHVHKINNDNTDFFDHHHRICDTTGPAIEIEGTDKHIHLLCGSTSVNDGHCHNYTFVTQVEAPLIK